MLHKKADDIAVPFAVSALRVLHCVLFCHVTAIVGFTFFSDGHADTAGILATPERLFALAVASPLLLGSFFFWLATITRTLFTPGIFFCLLPAFLLAALPMMMNVFFPSHLIVFALAAIYGISGIVLIQYFFAQPVVKKK